MTAEPMHIVARRLFRGANRYARWPVVRLTVQLGALEEWPTARLGPGFIEPLLKALPGLREHGCSYSEPGGFVRRLREDEGTWLGHVLEHMALELQSSAGADVTFGKTRSTGRHGEYDVIYSCRAPAVGLRAGEIAFALLQQLLPPELRSGAAVPDGFDHARELRELTALATRLAAAPPAAALAGQVIIAGAQGERPGVVELLSDLLTAAGRAAAVLTATPDLLEEHGLGFTSCSVGAMLGPVRPSGAGDDEAALAADLLHLPLEIARGDLVIDGDDELTLAAADEFAPDRVWLVSRRRASPAMQRHLRNGGRAVLIDGDGGGSVMLRNGAREATILASCTALEAGGRRTGDAVVAAALAAASGAPPGELAAAFAALPPATAPPHAVPADRAPPERPRPAPRRDHAPP